MANYATLKSAIQQVVKTNGNEEITGALLQQSLVAMINSLGGYYQFAGIATPSTNPGTPDQNVFYIGGPGTYTNFNGSVVPDGYIGVFKYNGSWNFETLQVGKNYDSELSQIEQDVDSMADNFMDVYPVNLFNKNAATSNRYVSKDSGLIGTNSSWVATEYIDVSYLTTGDVLKIKKTTSFSGAIGWAFYNENKVFTHGGNSVSPAWQSGDKYFRCSIPASEIDVDMITLNTIPSTYVPYVAKHKELKTGVVTTDKIANEAVTTEKLAPGAIGGAISGESQKYISFNVFDINKAQLGYINKNTGAFVPLSSGEYRATDFIPVAPVVRSYNYKTYGSVGGHAVYDTNKQYLRSTGETYTYVEGDGYVRFTITVNATYKFILYEDLNITGAFAPTYQEQIITPFNGSQIFAKENTPSLIPAYSSVGQNGVGKTAESLDASLIDSGGNRMNIGNFLHYLKSNRIVSFTAKITTVGTLDVGFGRSLSNGYFVRVDSTYIDIRKYTGTGTNSTSISKQAHGLTIDSFITVVFTAKYKKFTVNIVSSDGQYNYSMDDDLREQYGYAFAEVTAGMVVTNAVLRIASDRMRKPIWVIGDSYTSFYSQRWTYQMVNGYGIDQTAIIGLAGGTSEDMYPELQNALLYGTPKFLVWALGMNDSYWKWKDIVIKVEMLCRSLGIELILQTIPWPTDGSKASINNYVKTSGYRYVDVYNAVSSDENGTWYPGMLDDGVHPTMFGAKAIAGRYLVDFPELAQ